jgi:pyrimidine deaminase RibD-like protein
VSSDIDFMNMAIGEARKSRSDNKWDPKVGVVVIKDGKVVEKAHRGETEEDSVLNLLHCR